MCKSAIFFNAYLVVFVYKTTYVTKPNIFTCVTEMKIMRGKSKLDKIKCEETDNETTVE